MRIESEKKLFTSDDINKRYDAGILGPDDRVELLDGEIILMNPGRKHTACADCANAFFTEALGRRAIVSIQNPVVIDIYNEPKPDVLILKYREDFYASSAISQDFSVKPKVSIGSVYSACRAGTILQMKSRKAKAVAVTRKIVLTLKRAIRRPHASFIWARETCVNGDWCAAFGV